MIRLENNRADKLFLKEYCREIEKTVLSMGGLDDLSRHRVELENEFCRFIGTKYAMAVDSGTDALQLSLLALGIGKGDSVLVPDITYISTALVVRYVGAEPIFIDAKRHDLTIDEDLIKENIRPNTKAIIAVHMFGQPCAMDKIRRIARENRLFLVEDACQALGSTYNKSPVGSFGEMAAFSFSYYKPLSSLGGNGGMVVFHDKKYAEGINRYLNLWKQDVALLDLNRKFNKISLTDIVTAKVKLKYIAQIIASRNKIKKMYEEGLAGKKGIGFLTDTANRCAVRENFPVLAQDRDKLYRYLLRNDIKTEMPYAPMHTLDLFRAPRSAKSDYPVARDYRNNGLHLPLYSFMTQNECLSVIAAITHFLKTKSR